jgi:hypothetical protein
MWFKPLFPGRLFVSRRGWSQTASRRSPPRRRSTVLRLEAMEDRIVLSPLMVTSSADSGIGSLRATIASAASGSTIEFAGSVRNITLTSGDLVISTNLDIEGPGPSNLTINGNHAGRVFDISNNATVTIDQLTITGGQVVGANGGGVLNEMGCTLSMDHVVMTNNQSLADGMGETGGNGGGIENDGSLTVSNSAFSKNVAALSSLGVGSNGGAIDSNGPTLTVTDCTFTANQAAGIGTGQGSGDGGAINNWASTVTITNSNFMGNLALGRTDNGGAISNEGNGPNISVAIRNSTFTSNQCIGSDGANDITYLSGGEALGGAIDNVGSMIITTSTFTRNLAKGGDNGDNSSDGVDGGGFVGVAAGGGVCAFFGSTTTLTNCAFIQNQAIGGNSALGAGADAIGGGLAATFATTTLTNVDFFGNQAKGGVGGLNSVGGTGSGGGFYNGINSTATVSDGIYFGNQAVGGAGGRGAPGGDGNGGAIANGGGFGLIVSGLIGSGPDTSSLSLDESLLLSNLARGGAGGAGANGGDGFGGGAFIGTSTTLGGAQSFMIGNTANGGSGGGGGESGLGEGGGAYTIGTFTDDASTVIEGNRASTSGNNIGA